MITITCDCCQQKIYDSSEKITVSGGEDGSRLFYKSDFKPKGRTGRKIELARHAGLHFCSEEHFVEYLMGKGYTHNESDSDSRKIYSAAVDLLKATDQKFADNAHFGLQRKALVAATKYEEE